MDKQDKQPDIITDQLNTPTVWEPPSADAVGGLELLRHPFPPHQISKLPRGTKEQNACLPNEKRNCAICGGWHRPQIRHLDYVGHAALTDRLLDADLCWNWAPLAYDDQGLPRFDATGGLWIKLTVCGTTRLGYGHAESKSMDAGAREKEVIGDALRNAAMRFGAALDLWHKGDLHKDGDGGKLGDEPANKDIASIAARFKAALDETDIRRIWGSLTAKEMEFYTPHHEAAKKRLAEVSL